MCSTGLPSHWTSNCSNYLDVTAVMVALQQFCQQFVDTSIVLFANWGISSEIPDKSDLDSELLLKLKLMWTFFLTPLVIIMV